MLEIIYDADLIELPEDFTFFGVKAPIMGSTLNIYTFTERHPSWDGEVVVAHGPTIGHYHCGEENGFLTANAHSRLELIVPINSDSDPYIASLGKADGLYLQGRFFETLSTFSTGKNQHVEQGRFNVPPSHFYFLGEHTNVV